MSIPRFLTRHPTPSNLDIPRIASLWIHRMMVPLGGHKKLISLHGYSNDGVAELLGLTNGGEDWEGVVDTKAARLKLRQNYRKKISALRGATVPASLDANMARLAKLVGLGAADRRILEFAIVMRNEALVSTAAECLGSLSHLKLLETLSALLELPHSEVRASLDKQGVLAKSGLMTLNRNDGTATLPEKFHFLSDAFTDCIYSQDADPISLVRATFSLSSPAQLQIEDYRHLDYQLSVLLPYLKHATSARRKGVNLFMYGAPGTGKTQLSKVLAKELGYELFEVASEDDEGDSVSGACRLRAYRAAQCFLAKRTAILLFDEMEDISSLGEHSGRNFHRKSAAQNSKAWMNRMLEENEVPTIWLSNSKHDLDPAFVRRFDMIVELPTPPKKQRERIIREASAGMLTPAQITRLAHAEALAPAVVARAASVVGTIRDELGQDAAAQAIEMLIGKTLEVQGHSPIQRNDPNRLPDVYDPAFIHADVDLVQVAAGLVAAKSGRLCLYGPPGTGKTAFGRWLAQQMGVQLMVKRASDLLSMWVGENEKNVAMAFEHAAREGALLLIDEVDSFLQDRRGASRSWEVSLVNEMLTQMETFPGVFIASTNLMDGLDQAALRRFDLKVKFNFLQPDQSIALFGKHCHLLGFRRPTPDQRAALAGMRQLTPGDFATVARQHKFHPFASSSQLLTALQAECALKEGGKSAIGFLP